MELECLWFIPTVAWPSEAVRVPDESITSIFTNGSQPRFTSREALLV
jgi:hypothetical protein